ncbi:division/cell wall cluster transcriptional repressor MraZ [Enterovibrio sp. ZSDZ35]|uniref:Transcriptional regulator MraZ n=1 Tax=Enterovibrio qingdaonensis TaxID=2899818 RepID=A0ABT5QMZ7_9GAMM|nr:division/cell wall cluster transcriptional repressor MraZ [Enterovibrio sp. ZSDZ35]MDD1782254.1 division/cell wall cluster transcriptional repressor MraZ [Enterovibrio sp. ZSDZ35]
MLRGVSAISLDTKGRVALPKRYREELDALCDGVFVCTIDHQLPCLLVYPLPEWERIEAKLSRLSSLNPAERRLQRLLLGHAFECEMDGQGRLLISPTLRDYAGLSGKAMLVGQLNKFELWNSDKWQQQIDQDIQLQAESAEALSERLSNFSL